MLARAKLETAVGLVVRADATSAFAPVDDTPPGADDEILLAGVPAASSARTGAAPPMALPA